MIFSGGTLSIQFDPAKRLRTLEARGLDFARAAEVFAGPHMTAPDERKDYGEARWITLGYLDDRLVVLVWTSRDGARRIISLRKANEREVERYQGQLAGRG